jgi:hypothetical protein
MDGMRRQLLTASDTRLYGMLDRKALAEGSQLKLSFELRTSILPVRY